MVRIAASSVPGINPRDDMQMGPTKVIELTHVEEGAGGFQVAVRPVTIVMANPFVAQIDQEKPDQPLP
jgi:hypothetical protein